MDEHNIGILPGFSGDAQDFVYEWDVHGGEKDDENKSGKSADGE